MNLALMAAGPVTTIPLLLFTEGTRRIPLQFSGFLQYLAPSLHLCMGYFVFGEPMSQIKVMSFALVWTGLLLLIGDQIGRSVARAIRRKTHSRATSVVQQNCPDCA